MIRYLEEGGFVGVLVPKDSTDANERFQPNRVFGRYAWTGLNRARTSVKFKVSISDTGRDDLLQEPSGWRMETVRASWGETWDQVTITPPAGGPQQVRREFHVPNRFRVAVSVDDEEAEPGIWHRTIAVENLRESGGRIYSIRILEDELPDILQIRPSGVGDDLYFRAGGLMATRSRGGNQVSFVPVTLLPEPRRTPKAGPTLQEAVAEGLLPAAIGDVLAAEGWRGLWQFQADAIQAITQAITGTGEPQPILLTGSTASGKTESFLLPLLAGLTEDRDHPGTRGVFMYPTRALAADQARRFLSLLFRLNKGRTHPISLGLWDSDTYWNEADLMAAEEQGPVRSPFSDCPAPDCGGRLRFTVASDGSRLAAPQCGKCHREFRWLRTTREAIGARWPTLLLITPDSLHKAISNKYAWKGSAYFGYPTHYCSECGTYTPATSKTIRGDRSCPCGQPLRPAESFGPSIVVLDEAHMLKGSLGSNVAVLISRLRALSRHWGTRPTFIAASATVAQPDDFALQLFATSARVIAGAEELSREDPTRFHLFLMPIEVSVLNAVGQVLASIFAADACDEEINRVLVFSEARSMIYKLQASLPEFYSTLSEDVLPGGPDAAPTRSHTADLARAERHQVEAQFEQSEIRVLLSTQTLEVGVDFEALQLEVMTGATYSYNDYIQRVGRAGRKGVPALVTCILRPDSPLDYYYFEHCRELVEFSPDTLDAVPLRTDNPFLVRKHVPAVVQDFLLGAAPEHFVLWDPRRPARQFLEEQREEVEGYLESIFIHEHSWDKEILREAIKDALMHVLAVLSATSKNGTSERLQEVIDLSIRGSEIQVSVNSDDFHSYKRVGVSGDFDADFSSLEIVDTEPIVVEDTAS